MSAESDNAILRERIDVNADLAIFRVVPREGALPSFEPGQFTNLGLRRGAHEPLIRRALSIASPPAERGYLEFYVRRVEGGEFTTLLFELRAGASVWLDPRVYGRFTLADVAAASALVLAGTGTGIAPFLAMLRAHAGGARWRRCLLLEGARTSGDLGYRSELEALARRDGSVSYHPTLTREAATGPWRGLRGRVQAWLEPEAFRVVSGEPLDPARWQVLLCGNPAMIASATEALARSGLRPHHRREPGQIHSERYW